MSDEPRLSGHDDRPVYTIKTVVQETNIAPATLRAWERRYGVLSPGRSEGGYRLYSARDIAVLQWLKYHVDAGVPISRAVALLEMRRQMGEKPIPQRFQPANGELPMQEARDPSVISAELLEALMTFEEIQADAILSEAFVLYSVDKVVEEIITPTLVEVGERWYRNEADVVQEHFATAIVRRRLTAMFHAYNQSRIGPLAITGTAPLEWHDVGILSVSLALRRHGWRVVYLGQNVPAKELVQEIDHLHPDLVCLSASTVEAANELAYVYRAVQPLSSQHVRLVFGGRAFNLNPELRAEFPGTYGGASARDFIAQLTKG